MPMSKFRRVSLFILAFIVILGAVYILGLKAGGIIMKHRMEKHRAEDTREILKQMGSGLAVGALLPDVDLEELNGNPIKLSRAVGDKSLVSFMSPDCAACKIALDRIAEVAHEPNGAGFVLISDTDPAELSHLRDSLNLHCRFLYDRGGEYKLKLGVYTFPFNVVVKRSLVIEDIIVGAPEKTDLEKIATGKWH